jgi:hypothetical protein
MFDGSKAKVQAQETENKERNKAFPARLEAGEGERRERLIATR